MSKSDAVKNAFWRLRKKVGIGEGMGFYTLRKTGASLVEKIDPLAGEMYLSHIERGMKRHYTQRDWERLQRALAKVEKVLLKHGVFRRDDVEKSSSEAEVGRRETA